MNATLTKLNLGFGSSKQLLQTKLNLKLMKLNEEVTKMCGGTYITFLVEQPVTPDALSCMV